MFEFSIAKNYLWPRRNQLSVSLIGLLSIFVITLVIWLLLLFLSITEGIEKNWLNKVTSLNAPVRILPTENYYNSYYYQIDAVSSQSDYRLKSIHEKLLSNTTDPYSPEEDEEIPFYWPSPVLNENRELTDLVKNLFDAVDLVGEELNLPIYTEDYEVAGALMRLRQVRKENHPIAFSGGEVQNFLTQATYIASITESNTSLCDLLETPTAKDLNHMLYIADRVPQTNSSQDKPALTIQTQKLANPTLMKRILSNVRIKKIVTDSASWQLPPLLLRENKTYDAYARMMGDRILSIMVPVDSNVLYQEEMIKGSLKRKGEHLYFYTQETTYLIDLLVPVCFDREMLFELDEQQISMPEPMNSLSDCLLKVRGILQGEPLIGKIKWEHIEVIDADIQQTFFKEPEVLPPWICFVGGSVRLPEGGVVLPNNFREYQVLLGDTGYFAFGSATPTSMQEQRLAMTVCGFYDPGVMSVGARFALADRSVPHFINEASKNASLDPMLANGVQVWFRDLKKTPIVAKEISEKLEKLGLSPYWKVIPFYQYEFAKDLMNQFQSDRYLFMLIGLIILFVACSNIVSLLLLLVNDKKHEIGILLSLGAKRRSIAAIFGICGIFMGMISCIIGSLTAFFTLQNINSLVRLLNFLEGQQAFNAVFYGNSLPNVLSQSSLVFILIATPVVSMLAGLIPAIKACRLKPSAILRSDP